jgi:hypothetical protein
MTEERIDIEGSFPEKRATRGPERDLKFLLHIEASAQTALGVVVRVIGSRLVGSKDSPEGPQSMPRLTTKAPA